MSDINLGTLSSTTEEEPYLVFEEEDSPWWMWPMLATVMITRDQWEARVIVGVVLYLLAILLGAVLLGLWGILLALLSIAVGLPFGYYGYKYGREKAIEYSERLGHSQ
jgi:uncharacterized membrane protein